MKRLQGSKRIPIPRPKQAVRKPGWVGSPEVTDPGDAAEPLHLADKIGIALVVSLIVALITVAACVAVLTFSNS